VKIHVHDIEEMRFGDRVFTVATLDVPYYTFLAFDCGLPRPTPKPHHEHLSLRVRLIRPDGTEIESSASINLVSGQDPPARLHLEGLSMDDAPAGTEIASLRYEIAANPQ
jgi:hypothetical protein